MAAGEAAGKEYCWAKLGVAVEEAVVSDEYNHWGKVGARVLFVAGRKKTRGKNNSGNGRVRGRGNGAAKCPS